MRSGRRCRNCADVVHSAWKTSSVLVVFAEARLRGGRHPLGVRSAKGGNEMAAREKRTDLTNLLDRNVYVAHPSWCNGGRCDGRAQRRCRRCGGVQYDWGVNFTHTSESGRHLKNPRWFMHWYCNGRRACGLSQIEYMSYVRITELRQRPPQIGRARNAPWRRWQDMQMNLRRAGILSPPARRAKRKGRKA